MQRLVAARGVIRRGIGGTTVTLLARSSRLFRTCLGSDPRPWPEEPLAEAVRAREALREQAHEQSGRQAHDVQVVAFDPLDERRAERPGSRTRPRVPPTRPRATYVATSRGVSVRNVDARHLAAAAPPTQASQAEAGHDLVRAPRQRSSMPLASPASPACRARAPSHTTTVSTPSTGRSPATASTERALPARARPDRRPAPPS